MDFNSSDIDSGKHLVNLFRLVGRCESGRLQRGTKHHCFVVCTPVEKKLQKNAISRLKNGFLTDHHAIETLVPPLVVRIETNKQLTNLFSISNQPHERRVVNRIRGWQPILILVHSLRSGSMIDVSEN